jgi:hypothetical protein
VLNEIIKHYIRKEKVMKAKRMVIVFPGILVVLILLTSISFGATKCVNPGGTGGCYSSIQTAINAAANNDTVEVMPGIYKQNISIGKIITLLAKGVENTIIMPDTGNTITFITGSTGSKMAGFKIESSGGAGVYCNSTIDVRIENCIIQNCAGAGLFFGNGIVRASNNTIYNNSWEGIALYNGVSYLYSNIIYRNHNCGIKAAAGAASTVIEYNCVWENNPNYCWNAQQGNDIIQDPQVVDTVSGDFHLQGGSPCIDAGRPGISYLDCDGTRNDMGAYGGPSAYCGPGPVVSALQLVPATVVRGETFNIQAKGATR